MGVHRLHAVGVRDDHEVAPAARCKTGEDDAAGRSCGDGRALWSNEVDPGVEAVAARAEGVAHRRGERPGERDRARRERAAQRGVGRVAGDAIRLEPDPALEVPEGALGVLAEAAVDRGRGKAVPGEQELERGDVPPGGAAGERPAAEQVLAIGPERPARLRPRHAVGGQVGAALEALDRPRGGRAFDPVDRAGVDAARLKGDLKRREPSVTRAKRRGREHEGGEDDRKSRKPETAGAHTPFLSDGTCSGLSS